MLYRVEAPCAWMLIAVLLYVLVALWGHAPATPGTFTGYWWGHDRGLDIARDGRGLEGVQDSCCHRVIMLRFRLLHVSGTRERAIATYRVTVARVDKGWMALLHRPPPHEGQVGRLLLQGGVITDGLTTSRFCAANVDRCGA